MFLQYCHKYFIFSLFLLNATLNIHVYVYVYSVIYSAFKNIHILLSKEMMNWPTPSYDAANLLQGTKGSLNTSVNKRNKNIEVSKKNIHLWDGFSFTADKSCMRKNKETDMQDNSSKKNNIKTYISEVHTPQIEPSPAAGPTVWDSLQVFCPSTRWCYQSLLKHGDTGWHSSPIQVNTVHIHTALRLYTCTEILSS